MLFAYFVKNKRRKKKLFVRVISAVNEMIENMKRVKKFNANNNKSWKFVMSS